LYELALSSEKQHEYVCNRIFASIGCAEFFSGAKIGDDVEKKSFRSVRSLVDGATRLCAGLEEKQRKDNAHATTLFPKSFELHGGGE
jgi:hypothetical protein